MIGGYSWYKSYINHEVLKKQEGLLTTVRQAMLILAKQNRVILRALGLELLAQELLV
jgi:hypothetical protein